MRELGMNQISHDGRNSTGQQLQLFSTPIKVELHAIKIPFFRLDKHTGRSDKYSPILLKDGGILIPVHMPRYSAKKLFMAVLKKMTEDVRKYGKVKIPVEFRSNRELRAILGKQGNSYLKKAVIDLVSATFTHVKAIKNVKTGKYLEEYEHFALIKRVVLVGDEYYDENERKYKKADRVMVYPAQWVVDNFDEFYVHMLDYDLWSSLSPVAQRLYEILSYTYYANGLRPAKYKYSTLTYLVPLRPQKYFALVMESINPSISKLISIGYLKDFTWEQIGDNDWMFIFHPGTRAIDEMKELRERKGRAGKRNHKGKLYEGVNSALTQMLIQMPDLEYVDDRDVELIVKDIIDVTQDRRSERFYKLIAKKVDHETLRELLGILKADYLNSGRNEKSAGAVFVGMVKRFLKEGKIDLAAD